MIGWALRWAALWFGVAVLSVAVINSGRWMPSLDQTKPDIARRFVSPAEPPAAAAVNRLAYPIDGRGQVVLDAIVNGAPVRFLVDTGASLVILTPADARAAGFSPRQLAFNERASTANGDVRMATVTLREVRLDQLAIADVPAAVIKNLDMSLLGMSFLSRLQSYEMRDGKLTITW
jgi:aspartyl protease family protein